MLGAEVRSGTLDLTCEWLDADALRADLLRGPSGDVHDDVRTMLRIIPALRVLDLVQRSGAELRRLEVRDASDGVAGSTQGSTIRLSARGEAGAIVILLDALEHTYTAPLRFLSLRIEGSSDGRLELATVFRPREALAASVPSWTS
jgi:hypothetical protein